MSNFSDINNTINNSEHLGYGLSSQIANSFSYSFAERENNTNRGLRNKDSEMMPEDAYNVIYCFSRD